MPERNNDVCIALTTFYSLITLNVFVRINLCLPFFSHINEDKRKTEGQVAMFTIVNDIENCPVCH